MTAITLNLLAEEQQAREERAHDPLKQFIAIGLGVVTLFAACGGALSVLVSQKRTELQALETRWEQVDNAGAEEGEFQKTRSLVEEISTANRSRNLVAPQLALVKDLVPATVQLAQLQWTLSLENSTSDAGGEEPPAEGKRPPRAQRVERLALRMEGVAISSRPELEVDQFLRALRADERFNTIVEDIQLRSISRSTLGADNGGSAQPVATFVIECRYKAKENK